MTQNYIASLKFNEKTDYILPFLRQMRATACYKVPAEP